jgi:hypothetical protein
LKQQVLTEVDERKNKTRRGPETKSSHRPCWGFNP